MTNYFVATGLITALVVATGLALLAAREVREDLLEKAQDSAAQLVHNLNLQVHERFLLPTIARDGYVDLDRPEHLAALDEVVRQSVAGFDIHAVYFFDLEGRIVYSTTAEHRGFHVGPNPNYERAARGEISSVLVARGSPLDVSGQPGAVTLLETYVPAHALSGAALRESAPGRAGAARGPQTGVIEVYQDATELLAESRAASLRVAAISTVGIVALMLALWLWIRKAERTIDERTAALVEVNDRLAALSADLEGQVEDRTRRLLRAETLATVGTLSAGVAHEINNPLAAIASCAEGLLRRADAESLAAQEDFADFPEYLQIIRDEAFRVKEITRNLLDFSRQGPWTRGPVDVRALLQRTARLLEHRSAGEGKRLVLDLPEDAPWVVIRGDGASLRQMVLNLTINALDASPREGEVRWSLRRDPGGGVLLVCEDQGPGFTSEDLERALEPFYTRKEPGKGTGLGLAIAYGIAREHGGGVELSNREDGRGARVTVRLAAGDEEGSGA